MLVWRLIGWLLCLAAAAVLISDLGALLSSGRYAPLVLGELWAMIDRASLNLVQAVIQRYVWPWLWDPAIVAVLLLPVWVVLALPGAALAWRFRRRRKGWFR